jgi:hypothetical protein
MRYEDPCTVGDGSVCEKRDVLKSATKEYNNREVYPTPLNRVSTSSKTSRI